MNFSAPKSFRSSFSPRSLPSLSVAPQFSRSGPPGFQASPRLSFAVTIAVTLRAPRGSHLRRASQTQLALSKPLVSPCSAGASRSARGGHRSQIPSYLQSARPSQSDRLSGRSSFIRSHPISSLSVSQGAHSSSSVSQTTAARSSSRRQQLHLLSSDQQSVRLSSSAQQLERLSDDGSAIVFQEAAASSSARRHQLQQLSSILPIVSSWLWFVLPAILAASQPSCNGFWGPQASPQPCFLALQQISWLLSLS